MIIDYSKAQQAFITDEPVGATYLKVFETKEEGRGMVNKFTAIASRKQVKLTTSVSAYIDNQEKIKYLASVTLGEAYSLETPETVR